MMFETVSFNHLDSFDFTPTRTREDSLRINVYTCVLHEVTDNVLFVHTHTLYRN